MTNITKLPNQFVWVEAYRPQVIDDCVLSDDIRKIFKDFVEAGEMPHLLLSGSAGTGKTTVAKALCNELDFDFLFLNGSNEGRSIDTVRTTIAKYASTVSLTGKLKVVFIDEADYMNPDSVQPALRALIEEFSHNCRFIMTCNYPNRIMEAIRSRCSHIEFTTPKSEKPMIMAKLMKRLIYILKAEGVEFKPEVLAHLIEKHFPDNRKVINELQKHSIGGMIDEGILNNAAADSMDKLTEALKNKEFRAIRQWVVDTIDNDPKTLYRSIYDHLSNILEPESLPHAVVILAEYQYKLAFVADVEINTTALLIEFSANLEFK